MHKEYLILLDNYVFYEDGRIWSKWFKNYINGYINPSGYVQVLLKCTDGKQRKFYWHRVIWFAFNGEVPEGMEVNHINEDKTDNRLCNLNLMTPKENTNYGTGIERSHSKRCKAVKALDKEGNVAYEFNSAMEAGLNGFSSGAVSECCRNCYGKLGNIYKGLIWRYAV